MQHIRRMHMPAAAKDKEQMDASIDEIARNCYVQVRETPDHSHCGFCAAYGKSEIFYGTGSWEHRMEHVGKHLEEPDEQRGPELEDLALRQWLEKENLIVPHAGSACGWILRSALDSSRRN